MGSLWRSCGWLLLGSAAVLALSLGIRHAFGLFLQPMSNELGWGRETFAFAIAVQNLLWGLVQPFTGALADRWGVRRVVMLSALLYVAGLVVMAMSSTPAGLMLGAGVLIGIGLSGGSFATLLGAVGRAVPAEQRGMAMGLAAAAGSFGQFIMLPGSQALIVNLGWSGALLALAALAALMLPLASLLGGGGQTPARMAQPAASASQALRIAMVDRSFWLLAIGFFVCGFQVVFIGVHLPAWLLDRQLSAQTGTTVLALVGLFNIFGTWTAGWLGDRLSKPAILTGIYLLRAVVMLAFILAPPSEAAAWAFGCAMGLLWLSTVPPTNGTLACWYGVGNLSMLGGLVFLFHQLGAFCGGWLGGWLYDRTGDYSLAWQIAIGLSLLAALCNLPLGEQRRAEAAA